MEKISNYMLRFFKKTKMNSNYDLRQKEWVVLLERAKEYPAEATLASFLFGYVKGYRAAMAEMKKGGAA